MDYGYGYYDGLGSYMAISSIILIITLAVCVFMIICNWKIYAKAGQEGWKSIIPIYNTYVLCEIVFGTGNGMGWFIALLVSGVLSFIPFVFIVPIAINIVITYKLCKCFGKSGSFFIGMLLLPVVFYPILAFGDATYVEPGTEKIDEI